MRDIRLEYAGAKFNFDVQPWLDQREDDSGEEPLFTLITVPRAAPDRDTLVLDLVCACVGKVPRDAVNVVAEAHRLTKRLSYAPGQPVCVIAHWSDDSIIPPVVR